MAGDDCFDLHRFVEAQERVHDAAVAEIRAGRKRTHWMWFVFPQVAGLGSSRLAVRYSVRSLDEARAYLAHPVLGARLRECSAAVLAIEGRDMSEVFGFPDDAKLRSSMTLFERADGPNSIFARVLAKQFAGCRDERTLELLRPPAGR